MTIRQADDGDAAEIAEIWNRMIRDTARTFTTDEKTVDGLQADIAARGAGFLVAELDGQLAGFATYFPFRGGPGYAHTKEHSVILAKGFGGQGIGRALMQRLEEVARHEGVHSLVAGISGENPDGVAFHEAIGFQHVARLRQVGFKFGRWMDLVLMQKIL